MKDCKGGTAMINCKGLELLSQSKVTVSGIYDQVTRAYKANKPVIVYNCTWEGYLMTPISVMVNIRPSGNYIATASTLQLEIDPEDGVTIINMLAG